MSEIIGWINALHAEGHLLAEVRVASPWADHLVATGTLAAGIVAPPLAGEEERAVAETATGLQFRAVLCAA
jgi:hypothetical protein